MDHASARSRTIAHLNKRYRGGRDELVILDHLTRTTPYGWVFFYDSRAHQETGDSLDALGGNGPIVFERDEGAIVELPSYCPPDEAIRSYEIKRREDHGERAPRGD